MQKRSITRTFVLGRYNLPSTKVASGLTPTLATTVQTCDWEHLQELCGREHYDGRTKDAVNYWSPDRGLDV